jgi:hypothetical protein
MKEYSIETDGLSGIVLCLQATAGPCVCMQTPRMDLWRVLLLLLVAASQASCGGEDNREEGAPTDTVWPSHSDDARTTDAQNTHHVDDAPSEPTGLADGKAGREPVGAPSPSPRGSALAFAARVESLDDLHRAVTLHTVTVSVDLLSYMMMYSPSPISPCTRVSNHRDRGQAPFCHAGQPDALGFCTGCVVALYSQQASWVQCGRD